MTYLDRIDEITDLMEELVIMSEEIRSPDVRDTLSEEEIAQILVLVDVCGKRAKQAKTNLDAALNVVLSQDTILELTDLEVSVEKKVSAPKKDWDHQRLLAVTIEGILDKHRDLDTGTVTAPYSVLMSEIFDYAAVSYWRMKKLKELGINGNEYCEVGTPRVSFQISQQTQTERNTNDDIDFFD